MGETFRGAAISPTNQRTDQMILIISVGIVFALVVGGFVMAANSLGDQDHSLIDDPQKIVLDNFDLAETAQPQTLRELDFVMESESGCWGPIDTEKGYIDFYGEYLPDLMPLCVNNVTLSGWYVDVVVLGGYKPWETGGYIRVCQKFDFMGTINILWTPIEVAGGDCCVDYYRATFYVEDNFCLESNRYPDVTLPWRIDQADPDTIPDKEVCLKIKTFWTGCRPHEQPSQDFTIIHSHSSLSSRNLNSQTPRSESEANSHTTVT